MGKYVTLDLAKRHLNVEESYDGDDTYISSLIDVAEAKVAKELCAKPEELAFIDGGEEIPAPLVHAMLLSIGAFYAYREDISSVSLKEIPNGAKYLIDLYRDYSK